MSPNTFNLKFLISKIYKKEKDPMKLTFVSNLNHRTQLICNIFVDIEMNGATKI